MDYNNTSDFVSGFWNIYIIVLVLASVVGCIVFLLIQDKAKTNEGNTTGSVWDENLQEYNNPLPNWWRWMFYLTLLFALIYLVLYPGLGNFSGQFGWTMRGQYDNEMKIAEEKYGPIFDRIKNMKLAEVAADPQGFEMGKRVYLTYCATCHGSDAKGTKGFPNLTDKRWIWGGTASDILTSIAQGRDGVMTAKGVKPDMDAEQVKDVVAYVRSLAGLTFDNLRAQRGKDIYPVACAACHQTNGKGLPAAGWPDLTLNDPSARLYGTSKAEMIDIVTNGRTNRMPAWQEFLGEAKVRLVTAYICKISGTDCN